MDVGHALLRLGERALLRRHVVPFELRHAERDGAVGLGEAVEVDDVRTHALHRADDLRGGRCAAGRDGETGEVLPFGCGRGVHAREHRGRAAHVGNAVLLDEPVDLGRVDAAQADVRPADGGDGPRVTPAVAVEHGERPEVDAAPVQPGLDDLAERIEVRAPRMVLHALGHAGGAGRVVDGDDVHLGCDGVAVLAVRRGREELLVLGAGDVAGAWGLVDDLHVERYVGDLVAHLADGGRELGVEHEHLRLRVVEDVGDLARGEAGVDGDERRADAHWAVVRLQQRGQVGDDEGDAVASADACALQRPGEPVHAVAQFAVGVDALLVDDGRFVRVHERAPLQERERLEVLVEDGVLHARDLRGSAGCGAILRMAGASWGYVALTPSPLMGEGQDGGEAGAIILVRGKRCPDLPIEVS